MMRLRHWARAAAVLITAGSASAQDIDCEALRTSAPVQITYAVWPLMYEGQWTGALIEQYERQPDGTGRRIRRIAGQRQVTTMETRHNFVTRVRVTLAGRTEEARIELEGIAPDVDHFGLARDFRFVQRVHERQGAHSDENHARFRGEETMTVGGCSFRVLVWDIERRNLEPRPSPSVVHISSFWYAPELRAFLRMQASDPDRSVLTDSIATRIETRFTPFE